MISFLDDPCKMINAHLIGEILVEYKKLEPFGEVLRKNKREKIRIELVVHMLSYRIYG